MRSSTAPAINGSATVASSNTSAKRPPSSGGTNLPHETASVYVLRTNPHAIVVTFQRHFAIPAPRQQFRINSKLLRPIAWHAAADRKNPHFLRRQHGPREF